MKKRYFVENPNRFGGKKRENLCFVGHYAFVEYRSDFKQNVHKRIIYIFQEEG